MMLEERISRLEKQNRRLIRVLGCSAIAVVALSLVAAADLVNIVVGKMEVKNANLETQTTLLPNGDVNVGGNLNVRGKLILNGTEVAQVDESGSLFGTRELRYSRKRYVSEASDGLVVVVTGGTSEEIPDIEILVDGKRMGEIEPKRYSSACCPVRKGESWEVRTNRNDDKGLTVWWLPLQVPTAKSKRQ
jgi:hypothetical protein